MGLLSVRRSRIGLIAAIIKYESSRGIFCLRVARYSRWITKNHPPGRSSPRRQLAIQVTDDTDPLDFQLVRTEVSPERLGASRDVADAQGKKWRVREMEMPESDGSAARKSLIALNEMIIRRFWSFPPSWRELSDKALLALINGPAQPHPETKPDSE